jgi:adenine-specific DNA-methyltransferase
LSEIPVAQGRSDQAGTVIALVERILAARQRDADADVSALQREIDQLVYALYGLTPEEVPIVEGAVE